MLQPNLYTTTLCEPINTKYYTELNELIDYIFRTIPTVTNINLYDIDTDDNQEIYYINVNENKEYNTMILINKHNNKGEVTINGQTIYFIIE